MNRFRIRDLIVTLKTGWCHATPEKPEGAPIAVQQDQVVAPGGVACAGTAIVCVGSYIYTCPAGTRDIYTCPAGTRDDAVPPGTESPEALNRLKRQMAVALDEAARREETARQAIPEPSTPEQIEAVKNALEEAVQELKKKLP